MRKSIPFAVSLLVLVSMLIAACGATPEPEVVEVVVTQQVPVEVTKIVVETQVVQGAPVEVTRIVMEEVTKEVVVTATPAPVVKEETPAVLGVLPRSETFIAGILTGRVGSPGNFNEWVGWKSRDRGMQNLANEPLWSVVFATANRPIVEPEGRLHAFCHAVPGKWHLMGVMLSAAGSLRWYRDTLVPGTDFEALLAPAADIAPGSEGLLFLPYLTGERTPHPDPLARGAFVGLTVRHRQAHLTRAVLEGVAFGLRDSFELMRAAGLAEVAQVRITGGGALSPLWRQVLADVLGAEMVTLKASEGAAYGAALLAATGAGAFPDVESACAATIRITGSTAPGPAREVYTGIYPLYRSLYPALQHNFRAIACATR